MWPEVFRQRLLKLGDASVESALDQIDWEAKRAFVCGLLPSWRIAVLRVWSGSLLTSSQMGKGLGPCLFCGPVGHDRFSHVLFCPSVRSQIGSVLRERVEGWSMARLLGLERHERGHIAVCVLIALLHQKARHIPEPEFVRRSASELLVRPLKREDPVFQLVRGSARSRRGVV